MIDNHYQKKMQAYFANIFLCVNYVTKNEPVRMKWRQQKRN
jgi:hypothetical protein